MKKVCWLFGLFAFALNVANSQSKVENFQLPSVSGINKYVDFPIDKSTGVPGINIPIYTLQLKDFSFPITLSYHAGGIKVEEMASNIGLGWSLIADGEISRTVKRQPDEFGWYANHGTTEPQPLTIRPPV